MIFGSRGWNWPILVSLLPSSILTRLASLVVSGDASKEDKLLWGDDPNGIFTIKKAYHKLCTNNPAVNRPGWKKIWALKVQQQVRMFVWLLAHGKLLTNQVRLKQHLTANPICALCQGEEESNLHAIRDCPKARKVCVCFIPPEFLNECFLLPLQQWMWWNLSNGRMNDMSQWWGTCFAVISWWIWKWRNNEVFNGIVLDELTKIEYLNKRVSEMVEAYAKLKFVNGESGRCREEFVCWEKPDAPRVKIKVDGSSQQLNMRPGIGCVVRDDGGRWAKGEGRKISHVSPITAELLAVLFGLKLAWSSNYRHVILESDCLEAVDIVMGRCGGTREDRAIVQECKEFLARDWSITIRHIFREANKIADWIAKWSAEQALWSL